MTSRALPVSGLLNAIDGAFAPEGRVLIMTSNYPERLDEALVRPGRVDRHVKFTNLQDRMAATMFGNIYPDSHIHIGNVEGLSPAELQGIFLEHPDDAEAAAAAITKRAA